MYTLVFLICLPSGTCISNTPREVFRSETDCLLAREVITQSADEAVRRGEMAEHTAVGQCIPWGRAS